MSFHDTRLSDEAAKAILLTGPFGEPERVIALDGKSTVAEVIAEHGLQFRLPTIAVMNGEPVMRGVWALRIIRPGEVIAFVAVPRGGGEGGGGGKQIVGLIAALALTIAAPMIGGWVAGALFGGSTVAASLVSAALLAGGSLLLNALMATPADTTERATVGSVYSSNAASNQATPLEELLVLYGRMRFPPRFAARPYSEYQGNDQYLYQLFLVTAGKAQIDKIEIGDTEAWNSSTGYATSFSDLAFEIVQPGGAVTLFPANVVTSIEVSGQTVPDPSAVLGPFVVNAAGTTVDRLAVDFAFPGGLWTADGRAVANNSIALRAEYQQVDDDGDPVGGWSALFAETITAATRTPQRMTRAQAVTAGRYRVRFLADEAFDPADGEAVNACNWTGLRGYLTGFETPPDCTLLAMRIRANEQLSQFSASQINVTATRHLPVFEDDEWSAPQETRSIAWAVADLLRNSDYSVGLDDAQFDLAQLVALADTWVGRGDTFNALFDRSWTVADALRAMLRAGRAQPVRIAGRIGFVRLEPKQIKRATFTPRNVVRGSFQHKLVLFDEEKPDSVNGSYFDEAVWATREVLASLADIGSDAPQTVEWFGITDHDQAWRESVTEAAVNAYCREFVTFMADWEGKLLVRGDPVLVMHPFIEGVFTAALAARDGLELTADRDIAATLAGDGYVILRGKDGREWGPCLVADIDGHTLTLDAADLAAVEAAMGALDGVLPGDRAERAHILLCDGDTRPFDGLVVTATPDATGKVAVTLVNDDPRVYLADGVEIMPSPWSAPTLPPAVPLRPVVLGLYAKLRAAVAGLELDAMWQPAPGATGYIAQVSYDDEATWTQVYEDSANRFTVPVLPQVLTLRVAAVGQVQGPWVIREFLSGEMPDIRLPGQYLDAELDDIATGLSEDLKFMRRNVRAALAKFDHLGTLLAEQDVANFHDRRTLRRELKLQIDNMEAGFDEIIEVALGPGGAIAQKFETVYAALGGNSAAVLIRFVATAAPDGVAAQWSVQLSTDGETFANAGLYLQIDELGNSQIVLDADRTLISTDGGTTVSAMFDEDGALIRNLRVGRIEGPGLTSFWDLSTGALRIATT